MGENNSLKWFNHLDRKCKEFVKKVYVNEIEVPRRGMTVIRWKDRIMDYMLTRLSKS